MSSAERSILRQMKELGQAQLSPEEIQQMIAGVRVTLANQAPTDAFPLPDQPTLRPVPEASYGSADGAQRRAFPGQGRRAARRLTMRRVIMPVGMAAAVLIAAGVFFWGSSHQTASAAEMLKEIARSNATFSGWVKITFDSAVGKPPTRGAVGPIIKHLHYHVNPTRQIIAYDSDSDRGRHAGWQDSLTGVAKTYSSLSGEVLVTPLPPVGKRMWENLQEGLETLRAAKTLTLQQIRDSILFVPTMDSINVLMEGAWCTVNMQPEGALDRYNLTFVQERLADPMRTPASLAILVDRQTRRVQNWTATIGDETFVYSFRYNDPVLNDIFDLGLPGGTRVVNSEQRAGAGISSEAKALLDRLDKQVETDGLFGDYTAIIAASMNGTGTGSRRMEIVARRGQSVLNHDYMWMPGRSYKKALSDVPGWPAPDMREMIAAAANVAPNDVYMWDGTWVWVNDAGGLRKVPRQEYSFRGGQMDFTLYARIWPGRHEMSLGGEGPLKIKAEALRSAEHPGLIGLIIEESGRAAFGNGWDRDVSTWWLDPARGDVPVIKTVKWHNLDGTVVHDEVITYQDFIQMPTGQWYPQSWQKVTTEQADGKFETLRDDGHIQVRQDIVLTDKWFANPAERFPGQFQPGANAQP